jgi:N-acetylmuramoyl-L-alanine amidase
MRNMLAPHVIPAHWGEFWGRHDADWIKDWKPRYVKVVCDDETVPHAQELPKDAILLVRNYPLSEQGHNRGFSPKALSEAGAPAAASELAQTGSGRDLLVSGPGAFAKARDGMLSELGVNDLPEAVGIAHAQTHARTMTWLAARGIDPQRSRFEGLNEPMFWSSEKPELVARYELARLREAKRLGVPGLVLFNCGVGWPGNGGVKDAPPDYSFMQPVVREMRSTDALGFHEYWALNGPKENWKWWAGRIQQCTLQAPILITECGIDTGVTGRWYGGWGDLPGTWDEKARRYVDELLWYAEQCLKDGRVQAIFPFTYDIGSREWEKFDVRNQVFLGELYRRPANAVIPPPVTPGAPGDPAKPKPPTQPAEDSAWEAVKAQATDLRGKLKTNGSYAKRSLTAIKRIVVHHSTGQPSVTWEGIARYHVDHNKWPGIGYHFGIRQDGSVAYLGDASDVRWHAGDANGDSIGVCFAGTFTTTEPSPASVAAFGQLRTALERALGRKLQIVGHRDVGETVCPGDRLYEAVIAGEQREAVRQAMLATGQKHDLTLLNPVAALYRAIVAAGLLPVSEEFRVTAGNVEYVAQVGRAPGGPASVFYCPVGLWDRVSRAT